MLYLLACVLRLYAYDRVLYIEGIDNEIQVVTVFVGSEISQVENIVAFNLTTKVLKIKYNMLISTLLYVLLCYIRYNLRVNSSFSGPFGSSLGSSRWCGHRCSYYHHGRHHLHMSSEKEEDKGKVNWALATK